MAPETGTEFIPCEENPYYRLATVHGVIDWKMSRQSRRNLVDQNRVTWNRYFAQGLNDSEKDKLKTQGVPSDEIDLPLTATEEEAIRQRLNGLEKPNYKEKIDFRKVQFDLELDMGGFVFANFVDFSCAEISDHADFKGAKFSGHANFARTKFSRHTYFLRAKFLGNTYFWGVKFSRYVDFGEAKFSEYADFRKAEISGDAGFEGAKFSGHANFEGVKFSGGADFKVAKFSEYANFRKAEISGDAHFDESKFSGSASFSGAKFLNRTFFFRSKFSGDVSFNKSKFSGNVYFDESKFSGNAFFTGATKVEEQHEFGGFVSFAGATFEKEADFKNRVFFNKTTFDQCEFLNFVPNFAEAKLHQATTWRDVVWPSLPTIDKTEVKDDPYLDEASKIEEQKEPSRKRIYRVEDQVDAYRNLRLRMKQIENYQQEVFFLGKELDAKRRVHWLNRAYFRWFPSLVYKLFSDYGTSLARPVGGLLCLIASFGALVFWLTARGKAEALGVMEWVTMGMQSLWFSARYALPLIGPIDEWDQAISQSLPSGILVFTVGQTILGVVFLFLIGLALRNRFRIR